MNTTLTTPVITIHIFSLVPSDYNNQDDETTQNFIPFMFIPWFGGSSGMNDSFENILNQLFQLQQPVNKPASKSAVTSCPEIDINQDHLDNHEKCAVCQDEFDLSDKAKKLPCQHLFHTPCILPWLESHTTCPLCRYEFPVDKEEDQTMIEASEQSLNEIESSEQIPINHQCEMEKISGKKCNHNNEETLILECEHSFHSECLERELRGKGQSTNLNNSLKCPHCNKDTKVMLKIEDEV